MVDEGRAENRVCLGDKLRWLNGVWSSLVSESSSARGKTGQMRGTLWDVWFSPTSQSVPGSPLPCSSMSMTTAPPSASSDRLDLALLERSEPEISNLTIPS